MNPTLYQLSYLDMKPAVDTAGVVFVGLIMAHEKKRT